MRGTLVTGVAALAMIAVQTTAPVDAQTDIRSEPFQMTASTIVGMEPEPSIALSSKDHIYVCGPSGFPGGGMKFARSEDWDTFESQTISDRTGGGDCHVAVGADDAVYVSNLQVWASAVRKSTDGGRAFGPATEDPVEQDRQWLATDPVDPDIVYMGYHDWSIGAIIVAKSLDGAGSFVVHSVASTDPALALGGARTTVPGPIRVDPTDRNRVYMAWIISSPEECVRDCTNRKPTRLVVGRSDDGGITWTNHLAMDVPAGSNLRGLIPWISLDRAGNVYVVTSGHILDGNGTPTNGIFLAASTDRGETWTGPVKVNAEAGAVVFPTVAAGADGIVDFAWLESTERSADDDGEWTVRFAQSRDATSAAPTFTEVVGPLVHRGDVCTRGLLCALGGNRTLLDFMDMAIDRFGYAHVVVHQTIAFPPGSLYWRQDAGPSALSEPCDPDCVTTRPGPLP